MPLMIRLRYRVLAMVGAMWTSIPAFAALTIDSVTLNGASSVTVNPGGSISVTVNETNTGGSNWRSTAWRISTSAPGTTTCVDHPDHNSAGTAAETFTITAPTVPGTYSSYFIASVNGSCGGASSATFALSSSVTVLPMLAVNSIATANASPTNAGTVAWTVTFNRNVTGVTASDFTLVQSGGLSGAAIAGVTGSGNLYTVTATTGLNGGGTLGLSLVDDDSILDAFGNRLGGTGTGNGNFTGQTYTIVGCTGSGTGLVGDYFIAGGATPTIPSTPTLARTDATVDFNWGSASPGSGIPANGFAVRWSGQAEAPRDGSYTFCVGGDDGVRLWVDGTLIIDRWREQSITYYASAPVALNACTKHDIVMEYYENAGQAEARLKWATPGMSTTCDSSAVTIPQSRLYSTAPSISANAANFDCFETAVTSYDNTSHAGHPLYTKLVGTPFTFDVVALNASGAIETNFVGSGSKDVTVELFDDSVSPQPACSAYSGPVVPAQTVTFIPLNAGRKTTGTFSVGNAYGKLRCRVTDTNAAPVVRGCSTDNFTVRPTSFTSVTSTNANADAAGTSAIATPAVKAGSFFNLSAATGLTGYIGTPAIDALLLQWGGVPAGGRPAPGVGAVSGSFPAASSGTSSGSSFSYNEVGYFRFLAQGVYDDTFASASSDITNGDCTNDFSNALVSGKYGCKFGNTVTTNYFGRFIPDHFTVVPVGFGASCGVFTYMSQPFATPLAANIEARTLGNALMLNYSGVFAKGTVTAQIENANDGTAIDPSSRLSPTGAWSGGVYNFSASSFLRGATVDGPFQTLDIGVTVTDESTLVDRNMNASNTSCITDPPGTSTGTCTAVRLQTVDARYGRFRMANAFGSELLPLTMTARTEFYSGTGWAVNTDDNCTTLSTAPTSPQLLNTGGSTTLSCAGVPDCNPLAPVSSGDLRLQLSKPGTAGFADITLNVPTWLEFPWTSSTASLPRARATFGIYNSNQRLIYRRERY